MAFEHITVETDGPVTTLTLNRPSVMNAINPAMHHEMQAALDGFAADSGQYICVITGAGERAFCAGSDLKAANLHGIGTNTYPKNGYGGLIERFDLAKPVIAAVNGVARGGGFELALACDLIIASENASFGLPEPLVGAVALGGGLHRLARQIGLKRAMAMALTSEPVSAQEGLTLGFVNDIVPPALLRAAVARWCETILRGAPLAIRATKATMMRGLDEPSLAQALCKQSSYPEFVTWRGAADTQEGPRAFAEKRKPVWQGK
jgi:crotonobetainyl-CoA hydratase